MTPVQGEIQMKNEKPMILIVDDDSNNLTVLFDVLDTANYDVRIAKDGEKCLEIVRHENVDLVLLDVMMPGMNGFEVCSRLKSDKNTRDVPVIFMTALSETVNRIRGFELGAVDYISKPFQVEELMSRIKPHLKLRHLAQKEKEAEQMKSFFFSLVSRYLRIPLSIISASNAFVRQYGEKLDEGEKRKKYGEIDESVKKMLKILENLTAFSKAEIGQTVFSPELVSLPDFCGHICEEHRTLVQGSHEIAFSCEPGDFHIFLDPCLMRHAICALLANAVLYSPTGTRVDMHVFRQGKNEIMIQIRDEGPGISAQDQKRLFEPFFRGKNAASAEGLGLGLYTAAHFAQLHKGRILVMSEEGKGSVFTLCVPEKQEDNILNL